LAAVVAAAGWLLIFGRVSDQTHAKQNQTNQLSTNYQPIKRSKQYNNQNQVDLPAADPDRVAAELAAAFGFDPASALRVSAKTGAGVADALLPAIVECA
jgi:translation elongation factor EF-4